MIGCVFVDNCCPVHGERAVFAILWATMLLMQAHKANRRGWWERLREWWRG